MLATGLGRERGSLRNGIVAGRLALPEPDVRARPCRRRESSGIDIGAGLVANACTASAETVLIDVSLLVIVKVCSVVRAHSSRELFQTAIVAFAFIVFATLRVVLLRAARWGLPCGLYSVPVVFRFLHSHRRAVAVTLRVAAGVGHGGCKGEAEGRKAAASTPLV